MAPRLIYCDGKNKALAQIAVEHGFEYGIRYPPTQLLDYKITFVDVDWKKPNRISYLEGVKQIRPEMASVIDITSMEIFDEALQWCEELSGAVNKLIVIPKIDIIDSLPKMVNSSEIILGYSVPSTYGKTDIDFSRFTKFKVHLLGGSPHVQMRLYSEYPEVVYSVDGNYMTRMANTMGRFWVPGNNDEPTNRYWRRDLTKQRTDLFSISCQNVYSAWQHILEDNLWLRDRRRKT